MLSNIYNLRGIVGEGLNERAIKRFSKGVVDYIYSNNKTRIIVIGRDNRETSDYILSIIQSVLLSNGIAVHTIGVCTTPQLVYIIGKFKFSLGIMITASHNPKNYNGLKCFNANGEGIEIDIYKKSKIFKKAKYEKVVDASLLKELYLRELKNQLNPNKIKCIFDCANGATVNIVRNIFARQKIIGNDTTGKYINDGNGTESIATLQALCRKLQRIGFAFDGDGDRVVAVDSDGKVIDGDKIIYILARQFLGPGDKVVGTQISGLGLELALHKLGINLVRERVGAKYVYKRMIKEHAILGAERCGHVFVPKSKSADGVLVAIELLNILNRTGLTFDELLREYQETFKLTADININGLRNTTEFEQSSNGMREVVRKSGTEPKLRIFIEGVDKLLVERQFEQIMKEISTNN